MEEDDVRTETWKLKCAVIIGVVGVVLACRPATPVPSPPIPTVTIISVHTPHAHTPTSSHTSTPPHTLALTATPAPTLAPVPSSDVFPTLTRGPYLQSVTAESIVIVWETDRPSHGEVVYGEAEECGSSVADSAVGTRHAVTLTGLAPYTVYHYRVESDGVPLSEDTTFRTAAGPDQTGFTFAVLGDNRTQHQFHQAVVDRIVTWDPDFVLNTGDLVADGSETRQWDTFFEIERELLAHAPFFPALGNHEGNHPNYFDFFYLPGNERWYTFDYGNARFVSLQVDGYADFDPGSEQYAWLEETLAANTQPWLIVYFHIPPYTSVHEGYEYSVRQVLPPLFERYGVDVVFNGHKHSYERNEVNGVTYVVTAGGGAPLYEMEEREPTQATFVMTYHFMLLEIDGNHLKATAISSAGEVLDEFERSAD